MGVQKEGNVSFFVCFVLFLIVLFCVVTDCFCIVFFFVLFWCYFLFLFLGGGEFFPNQAQHNKV